MCVWCVHQFKNSRDNLTLLIIMIQNIIETSKTLTQLNIQETSTHTQMHAHVQVYTYSHTHTQTHMCYILTHKLCSIITRYINVIIFLYLDIIMLSNVHTQLLSQTAWRKKLCIVTS